MLTYAGCVTKDPDTDVHNVGIYRGMVGGPAEIPVLLWRAQHWGRHFETPAIRQRNASCHVIGWEPSLGFTAGAPVHGYL